jgi:hypothetical protein
MALGVSKGTLVLAAAAITGLALTMLTGQTVATCPLSPVHFPFSWSCGIFLPAWFISVMSAAALFLNKLMPWLRSNLKARRDVVRSQQDGDDP